MTTTAQTSKPAKTDAQKAADKFRADVEKWQDEMEDLVQSVVQREWMAITRALDMTRAEIGVDRNLTNLSLLYVRKSRDEGAADWSELIEMTDQQIRDALNFPTPPEK